MPKPSEVAILKVRGRTFEDWETVWVQDRWTEPWALFRFTSAERESPDTKVWTDLQFKPGDTCEIILGGQRAITGVILERQVAYDATSHMVQLSGVGKTYAAARSSVLHETNSFDGKDFVTVAREVLKPFSIDAEIIGNPSKTPFKELQCQPGENVWDFLERLARVRRIVLGSTTEGKFLIIGDHKGEIVQDLIEGINILKMQCIISIKEAFQVYRVLGAGASHDEKHGHEQKEQSEDAFGAQRQKWFSIIITPSEQPTKPEELKERAEAEKQWREYAEIDATITVQGWLRSNDALWKPGINVLVKSPMALLNFALKVHTVTFTQDSQSGTLTTLECGNPNRYNDRGVNVGDSTMNPPTKPTKSSYWTTAKDAADVWKV